MVASYTGWYTTARYSIGRCTSHTPGPMFPCSIMLDISTSGIMPMPNTSASQTSSRDLSEEVSFGIGNPLGSRSIELSNGCVVYTVVYTWYMLLQIYRYLLAGRQGLRLMGCIDLDFQLLVGLPFVVGL